MHIVAASMHHTGILRGKGKPCCLGEGERIVVGTKGHTIAVGVLAPANHRHHARLANTRLGFQSHFFQPFGHESHRAELLLAKFRVPVQVTPPAYSLFFVVAGKVLDGVDDILHVFSVLAVRYAFVSKAFCYGNIGVRAFDDFDSGAILYGGQ